MSDRRERDGTPGGLHPLLGGTALFLAVAGVLAAGAWGLAAPRAYADLGAGAQHAGHSGHGQSAGGVESITFPGGRVKVDRAINVDLSMPMQGPGMSMPMGPGVPEVPKGYRLVDVEVTLQALAGGGLRFDESRFQVQGQGVGPTRPQLTDQPGNFVPEGGLLSRTLTFQVPDAARDMELTIDGGDRPLPLKLGPAPAGDHAGH